MDIRLWLFNDAVSSKDWTASKVQLSVNNDMEGMWKEAVVALFERHYSQNVPSRNPGPSMQEAKKADHSTVNFGPWEWIRVCLKRQ
jgi:hypothetical protein